jgi:hypothetical protein
MLSHTDQLWRSQYQATLPKIILETITKTELVGFEQVLDIVSIFKINLGREKYIFRFINPQYKYLFYII